jgi:putative DNA primase/helicase
MGRHQWACKQAVRLACAHMLGCISETDWCRAQKLLGKRLSKLRAATGETVPAYEIPGVFTLGIKQASAKTDDQARAELGGHEHENSAGWLSDARISELLVDRVLRGNYCWSNGLGWMRWDGTKWSATTTEDVVEQSRRFAKLLLADVVRSGADPDTIRAYTRRLTAGAVRAAADLAKGQLLVDAAAFDAHPDLLNVANGVIDLRTGELGDHNPDLLLTKCAPTNYHPDAAHPDWDDALSALPADVADWIQTRFGQAITGHPTPDDMLPVLHGAGANGKTTITTAIDRALGEHATIVPDRVLLSNPGDHPTELMTLRGARLALLEETPEARHLNVKRLKDVLGTPQMTARLIRRDSVTWTATHSLFVSTNYRPRVEETDHGTWRRLALVTFPHTYRKPGVKLRGPNDLRGDPTLRERLKDGGDGRHGAVLAWLVTGARRWYENGQVMPVPPATVADDTRGWRHDSDLILRWFDDVLIADKDYYIPGTELYDTFVEWLNANGHQKWTSQTFADRFGQHDEIVSHRITHTRIWLPATDPGALRGGLTASRAPVPFGVPKNLPMRFRAWVGVRFRTTDDDRAQACD